MRTRRSPLARAVRNIRQGRMQRTLSAATAASAVPLTFEVYLEHYKGSFGDKWEWAPIALAPAVVAAGAAGVFSERAARTWLPLTAGLYGACGVIGTVLHARGVYRRPGGFREPTYNLVMGPPLLAPGSLGLIGAMGLLASDHAPRAMSDAPRGPHDAPAADGDRPASPPPGLPRQRRGTAPQGRSRYPDFDVLEQAGHWDEPTRKVVLDRVRVVPPIRFFDAREEPTMRAFCDVVTAQDREPRIPVLEMVDAKLHAGRLDGFQHADLPDDREVWRLAARGLDEAARERGAPSFDAAADEMRVEIVAAFHEGALAGGVWDGLPPAKAFGVLMRAVLSAFYSHPWAWNEIGFGGPAYPRGYARLGMGLREAWEGDEQFDVDPVRDVAERGVDR